MLDFGVALLLLYDFLFRKYVFISPGPVSFLRFRFMFLPFTIQYDLAFAFYYAKLS